MSSERRCFSHILAEHMKVCSIGPIISFITMIAFQFAFAPFNKIMESRGYNIINFELAWSPQKMDQILTSWGSEGIHAAIVLTWIDFGFILSYTAFLACSTIYMISKVESIILNPKVKFVNSSSIVMAVSDVLENILGLYILYNPDNYAAFSVYLMTVFSIIKWILVITLVLNLLRWLFVVIYKKWVQKQ